MGLLGNHFGGMLVANSDVPGNKLLRFTAGKRQTTVTEPALCTAAAINHFTGINPTSFLCYPSVPLIRKRPEELLFCF